MFLSVVIPAYNEESRLPRFLETARAALTEAFGTDYEVLLVNDGSRDGTGEFARRMAANWPQLAVLEHATNRGKGAAVRSGALASRGDLVLFADADGATPITEERQLRDAILAGADLAIGSRLVDRALAPRRPWHRDLLGRAFATLARRSLRLRVRDPQCGFKMFRGDVGRRLFSMCVEEGYLFDLELLMLARDMGHQVVEVPVRWADVPGSKLRLVPDALAMLRGLVRLRRRQSAALDWPRPSSPERRETTKTTQVEPVSRFGRSG